MIHQNLKAVLCFSISRAKKKSFQKKKVFEYISLREDDKHFNRHHCRIDMVGVRAENRFMVKTN